jgi:hypothetical protein
VPAIASGIPGAVYAPRNRLGRINAQKYSNTVARAIEQDPPNPLLLAQMDPRDAPPVHFPDEATGPTQVLKVSTVRQLTTDASGNALLIINPQVKNHTTVYASDSGTWDISTDVTSDADSFTEFDSLYVKWRPVALGAYINYIGDDSTTEGVVQLGAVEQHVGDTLLNSVPPNSTYTLFSYGERRSLPGDSGSDGSGGLAHKVVFDPANPKFYDYVLSDVTDNYDKGCLLIVISGATASTTLLDIEIVMHVEAVPDTGYTVLVPTKNSPSMQGVIDHAGMQKSKLHGKGALTSTSLRAGLKGGFLDTVSSFLGTGLDLLAGNPDLLSIIGSVF